MDNPRTPRLRWLSLSLLTLFVAMPISIALVWAVWYFGVYIGYGNYRTFGHQEFAANGVAQIVPASQMNQLFSDCRNYITYGRGDASESIWNSVAFFGGRYELTMQIPVTIESSTNGYATGEPQFFLNEVSAVDINAGQVSASFSRSINFGPLEWESVFRSGGDFSTIGFKVKTGAPVANFDSFAKSSR